MELIDLTRELPVSDAQKGVCWQDGEASAQDVELAQEHMMDIYIDEKIAMRLDCTPNDLADLVIGRLFSEGLIGSAEDVESLYICEFGTRARVTLRQRLAERKQDDFVETTGICCTGNHVMTEFIKNKSLTPVTPIPWEKDWFYQMAGQISRGTDLYGKTRGVHSCTLLKDGEILLVREDLGRHNALDKVIGAAMLRGINLTKCVLFSSGRLPMDMVEKAIRVHVPVLGSKSSATVQGVELARAYGLTLVTSVRKDRLTVFDA